MADSTKALKFTVRRREAVLVAPAAPTPCELKRLSDIDDEDALQIHIPVIQFYRPKASICSRDPALVIRDAVARALVHYYPLAGRLRELDGSKLAVDCTGEGVLFIEADADVRLEQFGDALLPPFPCLQELIFDVPGSSAILNSPLLLFQVTRLACGGFILAVRLNHTMVDAEGLTQFLGAVAEMARGAAAPTVRPVWQRELLEARNPPRPRFSHYEFNKVPDTKGTIMPLDSMVYRYIFFGPREVAAIRAQLGPHLLKHATRFDIAVGCLWKCRAVALAPDSNQEMPLICTVNARGRSNNGIPSGYYGNAFARPVIVSTAGELRANPVNYAVELVRKAKNEVDMEYMRSTADAIVLQRGAFLVPSEYMYAVSDATRARFDNLDFGWGRPVYGGPAEVVGVPALPWLASFILPFKNAKGEDGIVVPICLPGPAMDRFVEEMSKLLREAADVAVRLQPDLFPVIKRSAL